MRKRNCAAIFITAVLAVPLILFAQTSEDALHAQIRADVRNDPRATQLTQIETDALVNALADQAQKDGTADEYLASKNTFDYSTLFAAPKDASFMTLVTSPMVIAIFCLGAILFLVALYIIRHRGSPTGSPPDFGV